MSLMRVRRVVPALLGFVLFTVAVSAAGAGKSMINVSRGQLAMHGYDPVAYVTDGKPVPGVAAFEYRWMDAVWRFTTAEHRDRFIKDPEKFAPQFGGYCAYAVSRGYTADGDPSVWRIVDGRLYLNYSRDAQRRWEEDVPGNILKGQQNWPAVLAK